MWKKAEHRAQMLRNNVVHVDNLEHVARLCKSRGFAQRYAVCCVLVRVIFS